MNSIFRKPYPFLYEEPLNRLKVAGFVLLFVFLFLYIFQPFNINEIKGFGLLSCALIYAAASAAVCYLGASLLVRLYPKQANDQAWNIGRECSMMIVMLGLIGIVNYLIGLSLGLYPEQGLSYQELAWVSFSRTFSVGFFPVLIITFVNYTIQLKRNLAGVEKHAFVLHDHQPEVLIKSPAIVNISSSAKNNDIELDLEDLMYIMSDGNYVEFHFLENSREVREIRRNTITNVANQLKDYSFIFRTHRAFMVNLTKIKASKGNAQGYQLKLEGSDFWIPVSRGNLEAFDKIINVNNVLVEQYSV